MKYISVSNENKKKLARIFDVSRVAVWKALNFRSDSELSQKIRNVAMREMNGRVIRELDITGWQPNCQTEFVHEGGEVKTIISTFSNDVRVVLDCYSNSATITMNGEEVRRYWNAGGPGWGNILYAAEQLSIQ
jgi:hypothetical protein